MSKARNLIGGGAVFFCPGCNETHACTSQIWGFNGNLDKPTLTPSVDYKSGHFVADQANEPCWCTFEYRFPKYKGRKHPVCYHCHSLVRDGMIQFLGDCTHKLANQTVPIPEWPYEVGKYHGIEEELTP
jgi:hypothetical protein